jgi:DNA-binding CsgD family transcriptional regulator
MGPFAFSADRAVRLPEWSGEVAREQQRLSQQSAEILALIAAGHSYEQILSRLPDLTYLDIFASAREVLALLESSAAPEPKTMPGPGKRRNFVERARQTHKRAFARWTADEDAQLTRLLGEGRSPEQIAQELQRHKGAIEGRIVKLGLEGGPPALTVLPSSEPSVGAHPGASPDDRAAVPGWDRIRLRLDQEPSASG